MFAAGLDLILLKLQQKAQLLQRKIVMLQHDHQFCGHIFEETS